MIALWRHVWRGWSAPHWLEALAALLLGGLGVVAAVAVVDDAVQRQDWPHVLFRLCFLATLFGWWPRAYLFARGLDDAAVAWGRWGRWVILAAAGPYALTSWHLGVGAVTPLIMCALLIWLLSRTPRPPARVVGW